MLVGGYAHKSHLTPFTFAVRWQTRLNAVDTSSMESVGYFKDRNCSMSTVSIVFPRNNS